MGSGGDINRHKHFHPRTIANIQRLKEVEMERSGLLSMINERRAREKEQRSSEEIQSMVFQAKPFNGGPERLDWMYQCGAPPPAPGASASGTSSSSSSSSAVSAGPEAPVEPSLTDCLEASRHRREAEAKLREDPLFEIESKKIELGVAAYLNQIRSEKRQKKMEKRARKLEKKEKKKEGKKAKKEQKSQRKLQKKREKKARKQAKEEREESSHRAPSTSSSVC